MNHPLFVYQLESKSKIIAHCKTLGLRCSATDVAPHVACKLVVVSWCFFVITVSPLPKLEAQEGSYAVVAVLAMIFAYKILSTPM